MAEVSIIIPAYNRVTLLDAVIRNALIATAQIDAEIIVVDDGSDPPLSEALAQDLLARVRIIRQVNKGLVYAKYKGLMSISHSTFVLFLDSDDFFDKEKLALQLQLLKANEADICYTDTANVRFLTDCGKPSAPFHFQQTPEVFSPEEFYLHVQPSPHSPLFSFSYLKKALESPLLPLHPIFNPIGEVWFYYNFLLTPAKIVKLHKPCTWTTLHDETRITQHWERMGVASLTLMRLFMKKTENVPEARYARELIGAAAFQAYRKLPRKFNSSFESQMLEIWRLSHARGRVPLGGTFFQALAALTGYEVAAKFFRIFQRPVYKTLQTIEPVEMNELMNESAVVLQEL